MANGPGLGTQGCQQERAGGLSGEHEWEMRATWCWVTRPGSHSPVVSSPRRSRGTLPGVLRAIPGPLPVAPVVSTAYLLPLFLSFSGSFNVSCFAYCPSLSICLLLFLWFPLFPGVSPPVSLPLSLSLSLSLSFSSSSVSSLLHPLPCSPLTTQSLREDGCSESGRPQEPRRVMRLM